jgi:hypothetical protein
MASEPWRRVLLGLVGRDHTLQLALRLLNAGQKGALARGGSRCSSLELGRVVVIVRGLPWQWGRATKFAKESLIRKRLTCKINESLKFNKTYIKYL